MYCEECQSPVKLQDYEYICQSCGLVNEVEYISTEPHRNQTSNGNNSNSNASNRSAATNLMHDKGMGTVIMGNRDADGTKLDPYTVGKLRRGTNQAKTNTKHSNRRLLDRQNLYHQINSLGLNDVEIKEQCLYYLDKLIDEKTPNREYLSAAVILHVLHETNYPLRRTDLLTKLALSNKSFNKYYKLVRVKMGIKAIAKPVNYVGIYCSKLKLTGIVHSRALQYIAFIEKNNYLSGKSPHLIGGVCVYVAACLLGEYRTQIQAAKIMGVASLTLRETANELTKILNDRGVV